MPATRAWVPFDISRTSLLLLFGVGGGAGLSSWSALELEGFFRLLFLFFIVPRWFNDSVPGRARTHAFA